MSRKLRIERYQELLKTPKREPKLPPGNRKKKWLLSKRTEKESASLLYLLAYLSHVSTRQHFQVRS